MIKIMTLLTTSLLLLTSCVSEQVQQKEITAKDFIVNGAAVKKNNLEGVVALSTNKGQLYCTGNLIEKNKIMTAGHCVASIGSGSTKEEIIESRIAIIKDIIRRATEDAEEQDLDIEDLELEQQKALIFKALKANINAKAKDIYIHFGNGKSDGPVRIKKPIVRKVSVNKAYLKFVFDSLFQGTPLVSGKAKASTPNSDQAILTLSRSVNDVKIIPLANRTEFKRLTRPGSSVTVVGFGAKVDPTYMDDLAGVLKKLEQLFDKEKDEAKKEKIAREYAKVRGLLKVIYDLYDSSGDKQKVTVEVKKVTSKGILLETDEDEQEGACHGDSGGPIFGKLPNGSLRQIGTVSIKITKCGLGTFIGSAYKR